MAHWHVRLIVDPAALRQVREEAVDAALAAFHEDDAYVN